jgi:hypothetical protein
MRWLAAPFDIVVLGALTTLPGAWITFLAPGAASTFPFWTRLWLGSALSPFVVLIQFYALRLVGLPFEVVCPVLLVVNLVPAWALIRQSRGARVLIRSAGFPLLAIGAVCLAYGALYWSSRAFIGHPWMHTDTVYQLAGGLLRPEDPDLAGARLAYPWFGHVQVAVVTWLMRTAPLSGYVWLNVCYLIATLGVFWAMLTEIGIEWRARIWGVILLLFGIDFVGYFIWRALPDRLFAVYPVFGDIRYMPWLRRFLFFEQPQEVLPIYGALLLVALVWKRLGHRLYLWLLATLLLAATGILYSIFFPAACFAFGGLGLIAIARAARERTRQAVAEVAGLAAAIGISALATLAAVRLVTVDRDGPPGIGLSDRSHMFWKSLTLVVILAPMLPWAVWAILTNLRQRSQEVFILSCAAAGCAALYVIVNIAQGGPNEYKWVFPLGMAVASLSAMGAGAAIQRAGRHWLGLTLAGLVVLAFPAFHRWFNIENPRRGKLGHVNIAMTGFDVRLQAGERYAGATDAVRGATPTNTVVVTMEADLHLPTLTRRPLYAPYADGAAPGYLHMDQFILEVKGYPAGWLHERRQALHALFQPASPAARIAAFEQIQALRRPCAFVVDDERANGLSDFLQARTGAKRLYAGQGLTVWLVPPRA